MSLPILLIVLGVLLAFMLNGPLGLALIVIGVLLLILDSGGLRLRR